jgi:hypothetical protein
MYETARRRNAHIASRGRKIYRKEKHESEKVDRNSGFDPSGAAARLGAGCHIDFGEQSRELAAVRRLYRSDRSRGDRPKGRHRSNSETYSSSGALSRLKAAVAVLFISSSGRPTEWSSFDQAATFQHYRRCSCWRREFLSSAMAICKISSKSRTACLPA